MFKKFGKFLQDKYLGGLLVGLTIWALKYYTDLPKNSRPVFFKLSWITGFLQSPVPVWIVIIGLAILFSFYKISLYYMRAHHASSRIKNSMPDLFDYKSDKFGKKNSCWTWSYQRYVDGTFEISTPIPICPDCGTPMVDNYGGVSHCFNCKLEGRNYIKNVEENVEDVTKAISHRISTGQYRNIKA